MIVTDPDAKLGRRVPYKSVRRKVKNFVRRQNQKHTMPPSRLVGIFKSSRKRQDGTEKSVDLLTNLPWQTRIADQEWNADMVGWAVLVVGSLAAYDLRARLTWDVNTNPLHVVVWYTGKSDDYGNRQFRIDLARCITRWQDRINPAPLPVVNN